MSSPVPSRGSQVGNRARCRQVPRKFAEEQA